MKKKGIRVITVGLFFILFTISISPLTAKQKNLDIRTPNPIEAGENIVADISMVWGSFLQRLSLKDLEPIVTINQNATRDFYFPEVNGTILQINFSVICRHRLNHTVLLPRFTRVYIGISYNGSFILVNESNPYRCQSVDWEYINFTVESNDQFDPLVTNGENITLTVEVGAFFFFFKYWGAIESIEPIVIHPIATRIY
ncbi:MAG: hypothetical protein JW840_07735 [Candidatus Thermoplasmatota archaeon]|nr:hypothetical protein [Candidatus Thermoplasmatota archaeon]